MVGTENIIKATSQDAATVPKFCGAKLDLCCATEKTRFIMLAVGALVSAVGFAYLQEVAIREEGFKYFGYMTLLTSLTFAVCGQIERVATRDTQRVGLLMQYLILSTLTFSGMAFTNASLKYINYPTRVLFKSSKLLPTMIVGSLMQASQTTSNLIPPDPTGRDTTRHDMIRSDPIHSDPNRCDPTKSDASHA